MPAPMKMPEATRQIAKMFKAKRKNLGLSFTVLARKAKMSRTTISDIEAGRTEITIGVYLTLCKCLDIHPRKAMPDIVPLTHEQKLLIDDMVSNGASPGTATEFVRINCRNSVDYD